MMKAGDYVDLGTHKKFHDDFLGKLDELKAPLPDDTISFAKDW